MIRTLALSAALLAAAQPTSAQTIAPPAPTGAAAPATAAPPAAAAPAGAEVVAPATAVPAAQPTPAVAQPVAPPPAPAPAAAQAPAKQEPRGRLYTWGGVGTTFAYGETYGSASFGVGYLMKAGITPNLEATYAFGASPTMWALRPGVTWFTPIPVLHPYVGAYYTHWFVSGSLPDTNGIGARAGISLGRVLSLGVTYDHALDCSKNCDTWSPQIGAGFSM
jgi:hypothetical protein